MVGALTGLITGLMGIGSQVGNYFLNQAQMDKQNRYNSPAAQMHRLRVAGINPYAAIPQIAGQNQGQMATADFDFGQALGQAVNAYSTVENVEMNRALTEKRVDKLIQEIRGLGLDNYFTGMTMQDRIREVGYKAIESMYDADSSMSLADVNYFKSQWERYLAGQENTVYSPDDLIVQDGEVIHVLKNKFAPKQIMYSYNLTQESAQAEVDRATQEYKIAYENFKQLKTEQDYKIAVQKLIRESAAATYEAKSGMPFANKDPWSHYIVKAIEIIKGMPKDLEGKAFWEYIWRNL